MQWKTMWRKCMMTGGLYNVLESHNWPGSNSGFWRCGCSTRSGMCGSSGCWASEVRYQRGYYPVVRLDPLLRCRGLGPRRSDHLPCLCHWGSQKVVQGLYDHFGWRHHRSLSLPRWFPFLFPSRRWWVEAVGNRCGDSGRFMSLMT